MSSDTGNDGAARSSVALGPRAVTAAELQAQIGAERDGIPFLVYRDGDGAQHVLTLDGTNTLWVGRTDATDVRLAWDSEVSALHAQLERGAGIWILVDDGLSRNGSFVNGERVVGRRSLQDGDMLRFGQTVVLYRSPTAAREATVASTEALARPDLSDAQRRVLVALCRPFKDPTPFASPPTNPEIADELVLSVDAVKTHLRALFEKFEVDGLAQNRKRISLVERALQSGAILDRDL